MARPRRELAEDICQGVRPQPDGCPAQRAARLIRRARSRASAGSGSIAKRPLLGTGIRGPPLEAGDAVGAVRDVGAVRAVRDVGERIVSSLITRPLACRTSERDPRSRATPRTVQSDHMCR
jgi:hypothetical protein